MSNRRNNFFSLCILLFFASCEGDYYIQYHFTGLDLENAENTGEKPLVTNNDSIPKEAYALRLYLFPVETSREGRYLDPETSPRNTNPIDSISIFSDTKFNDSLPIGTRLNSVFRIFNRNYLHVYPVDDLKISNSYNSDFFDEPVPEYVDLLLMYPPDSIRYFKFHVFMKLNDGTIFIDSTEIVKLF